MGIQKEILRPGTGPKPLPGHNVTVHCTGYGKNGDISQKFWSTNDPGQKPFTFKLAEGSVIKGLDEGVMDMHLGEVARLRFSPDYAYGSNGFPAWGILPNSVLVFEIELISLQFERQSMKGHIEPGTQLSSKQNFVVVSTTDGYDEIMHIDSNNCDFNSRWFFRDIKPVPHLVDGNGV